MAMVEALQRAIDFMEDHLLDNLTIEDIAKEANISPFHFQRIFMILTDISIGEYIRRRRLSLAAQELSSHSCKVIDLAHKYGYETPEAFSKAFRKQHQVSPSEVKKGIGRLQSFNRLSIQVQLKGAEPMNYRIVEREAFQVVGMKRTCSSSENRNNGLPGIEDFWSEAHQNGVANQLLQLNDGEIKGLLGISDCYNEEKEMIDYWIATETNSAAPEGLAIFEFPATRWVAFEVRGPVPTSLINTWKQIYSEWFPSNGYEPADIAGFEAYLNADIYQDDAYNEIWVAIK